MFSLLKIRRAPRKNNSGQHSSVGATDQFSPASLQALKPSGRLKYCVFLQHGARNFISGVSRPLH